MLRRYSPLLLTLQFISDVLLTGLAVKLAEQARLHLVTGLERREQFVAVHPAVYLLVLVLWPVFFTMFGLYDPARRRSLAADLGNLWVSITVAMLVLASLFYLLGDSPPDAPSRLFYLYFYVLDLALLGGAHVLVFEALSTLRRRGRNLRRVLLVGDGVLGRHAAIRLRNQETAGIHLLGYLSTDLDAPLPNLHCLGPLDELGRVVDDHAVEEVVVALPSSHHSEVLRMAATLSDRDVQLRILPDVFELVAMRARVEDLYGLPLISIGEPSIGPVQARVKRAFDVLVASILLLLTSPLMLLIALWVRLDSPGPVIIHQRRIGAGGLPFSMHKFRSMYWNPESLDVAVNKSPGDPRVTRAGRFIRRASLDELPQLWNVLTGDMSLVGPRPELPAVVEQYEPWQRTRFAVPPGMTGWWQVNGRASLSMHQHTEIDLYYVQNYSILLDVQILLRTLGAVIRGRGAF